MKAFWNHWLLAPARGHRGRVAIFTVLALSVLFLVVVRGGGPRRLPGTTVYETTSPYHHVQVVDHQGLRTLSFNGTRETQMSIANPLEGHFGYTEYFHLVHVWQPEARRILMLGLGGGSAQRAFLHHYPEASLDTVELDPTVVEVAGRYFHVLPGPRHRIHVMDGRVYLRRSGAVYDVILLDAYTENRYGSYLPYHMVTREFFQIARGHLAEEGVLAINVIGTVDGWRADILGAVYRTMQSVFDRVYLAPAHDSRNVMVFGVKTKQKPSAADLRRRAEAFVRNHRTEPVFFLKRFGRLRSEPPASVRVSPILTDDFAPVDGILRSGKR